MSGNYGTASFNSSSSNGGHSFDCVLIFWSSDAGFKRGFKKWRPCYCWPDCFFKCPVCRLYNMDKITGTLCRAFVYLMRMSHGHMRTAGFVLSAEPILNDVMNPRQQQLCLPAPHLSPLDQQFSFANLTKGNCSHDPLLLLSFRTPTHRRNLEVCAIHPYWWPWENFESNTFRLSCMLQVFKGF